jgi:sensor histidine kinase YesM
MPERFRRTHYLTDWSLQLPYLLLNLFALTIFFVMAIFVTYYAGWAPLVEKLSQVYPQGRLVEILERIYLRLTLGFLCLLPVALGLTLFLSHRVAGPLVRIKRYLRLMAKGEFDLAPLVLRRYDELKDVAELLNEIADKMNVRVKERRRLIESLQSTVHALRSDLARLPAVGQEVHRKVNYLADTLKILE